MLLGRGDAPLAVCRYENGRGHPIAFARERLSSFKCPRSVLVVDELPRLATGKLQSIQDAFRRVADLGIMDPGLVGRHR